MKYIALAKIILTSVWLQRVAAREEDGMRDIGGAPDGEEKILKPSCVRYGDTILLKNEEVRSVGGVMWLTGKSRKGSRFPPVENRKWYGWSGSIEKNTYRWIVHSKAVYRDETRSFCSPDPSAGQCVLYNDSVTLENVQERLLLKSNGGNNAILAPQPRSEAGTELCKWGVYSVYSHSEVGYGDTIYLQNSRTGKWLAGSDVRKDVDVGKVDTQEFNPDSHTRRYKWNVRET